MGATMSEQTTESTEPTTEAQEPAATPDDGAQPDEPLREPGKKALAAERKAREAAEKAAAEYAAKLKEIETAQMSDLERAQAAAREAQEAAAKAATEALRWKVAAQFGITAEDAEVFLTGTDEAAITRQAERLAALAKSTPATPKPDRSQGAQGTPPALNSDGLEQALRNKLGIR